MDNKRGFGFAVGGGPLKKIKGLPFGDDEDDDAPSAVPIKKKTMTKMPLLSEEVGLNTKSSCFKMWFCC